jgi:hypothetical protein
MPLASKEDTNPAGSELPMNVENPATPNGQPENSLDLKDADQQNELSPEDPAPIPEQVFCFCKSKDELNMIQCDACEEWFHFKCVKIFTDVSAKPNLFSTRFL